MMTSQFQATFFSVLEKALAFGDPAIEQAVFSILYHLPLSSSSSSSSSSTLKNGNDCNDNQPTSSMIEAHNNILDRITELVDSIRLSPEQVPLFMAAILHPYHFGLPSHLSLLQRVVADLNSSYQKAFYFTTFFCNAISRDYRLLPAYLHIIQMLVTMKEDKEELSNHATLPKEYSRILVLQLLERIPKELLSAMPSLQTAIQQLVLFLLASDHHSSTRSGHHVQNSEENGMRLRTWQALTILCRHVTQENVNKEMRELFRYRFEELSLKDVRHYMELVGIQLCSVYV